MYEYRAIITRVVDGDTFDAEVDVGFSITINHRFRLKGIDTPETWRPKTEAEREHGEKATLFVKNLIEGKEVLLTTNKLGIYGRYETDLVFFDADGFEHNLCTLLLIKGFEKRDDYTDDLS